MVNVEGDNLGGRAGPFPGHEWQDRCIHQAREGTEELDAPCPVLPWLIPAAGTQLVSAVAMGAANSCLLAVA